MLGWVLATGIFVTLTQLLGGATTADSAESTNTVWAIAHGIPSCAYAPGNQWGLPFMAPLYPLLSSVIAAVARIGGSVPFPSRAVFGPHCKFAIDAMYDWSTKTGALERTLRIGYVGWLALITGVIALLRSSGRGRCGWEPMTLLLLACSPPVIMCVQEYFHPEDLVALGLALGSISFARRRRWLWAGVLLGLAVISQQYVVLFAAVLLVVAPRNEKLKMTTAAVGAAAAVLIPLSALASWSAVRAAVIGSGAVTPMGDTLVDQLHLGGPVLFLASRFVPLVLALVIAWMAERLLGTAVLEPLPMVALAGLALSMRLLFEVGIFGYKFMAVGVTLVLLDIIVGRLRISTVIWIGLVTVAFHPWSWGSDQLRQPLQFWFPVLVWQLLLVSMALVLVGRPPFSYLEQRIEPDSTEVS